MRSKISFKKIKKPKLIAEISANHNGKLHLAKKIILSAKKNGADFIKLQTFKPETITINSNKNQFLIKDGIWKGRSLWNVYKKGMTPYEWHEEIFRFCKKLKITCFSTPFDEYAVDFLENLNCPIYKVASFELTHLNLIKKIAQTKKSTAYSSKGVLKHVIFNFLQNLKISSCHSYGVIPFL